MPWCCWEQHWKAAHHAHRSSPALYHILSRSVAFALLVSHAPGLDPSNGARLDLQLYCGMCTGLPGAIVWRPLLFQLHTAVHAELHVLRGRQRRQELVATWGSAAAAAVAFQRQVLLLPTVFS